MGKKMQRSRSLAGLSSQDSGVLEWGRSHLLRYPSSQRNFAAGREGGSNVSGNGAGKTTTLHHPGLLRPREAKFCLRGFPGLVYRGDRPQGIFQSPEGRLIFSG